MATTAGTIDLTPTWGEWGNIYRRLAESGERNAVRGLAADFAKAMAACAALQAIRGTLTDDQHAVVARTMVDELTKQGF
jgi:hypothetical protein